MISGDSPDVWARREQFMLDATVGVPPDAFSATGQDWGLPPWRWDVMQGTGFQWMRQRARRTAALFDGVRIDHLVGLYRIYVRPIDGTRDKVFSPPDEPSQSLLGAKILGIYLQSGIEVVAEDLGTVPPFVRFSMARLGVPGFKVMRWERAWDDEGQPFVDPSAYPDVSVALSGTHDTESLAQWWRDLTDTERAAFLALPSLAASAITAASRFVPDVRDALVGALVGAASHTVMLPLQDLFGWDVRINTPATVNDRNWTWRVAHPVDCWRESPEWVERAETLRAGALRQRAVGEAPEPHLARAGGVERRAQARELVGHVVVVARELHAAVVAFPGRADRRCSASSGCGGRCAAGGASAGPGAPAWPAAARGRSCA